MSVLIPVYLDVKKKFRPTPKFFFYIQNYVYLITSHYEYFF